jgi:hypothetical protein
MTCGSPATSHLSIRGRKAGVPAQGGRQREEGMGCGEDRAGCIWVQHAVRAVESEAAGKAYGLRCVGVWLQQQPLHACRNSLRNWHCSSVAGWLSFERLMHVCCCCTATHGCRAGQHMFLSHLGLASRQCLHQTQDSKIGVRDARPINCALLLSAACGVPDVCIVAETCQGQVATGSGPVSATCTGTCSCTRHLLHVALLTLAAP